jgi:WD40 repeat protein
LTIEGVYLVINNDSKSEVRALDYLNNSITHKEFIYILDMKVKPAISRSSSSSAPLIYTKKSSVRSSPDTNDCYAVDLTLNSIGNHVAVLTIPNTIQLFDASTLKHLSSFSSTSNNFDSHDSSSSTTINSIQFAYVSPHTLFASTNKNLVLAWDTRTPQQETFQLNGCADEHKFLSVTCNNEDLLIAAGTELKGDENVAIAFWDLRAPVNKQLLGYYTESHSDDIIQVEFSRMNSTKLISGSTDGLVCLYDVSKPNEDDALEQVFILKII